MKTKILQWIGKRVPESYQTKLGGFGLVLVGVLGIINIVWEGIIPALPPMTLDACIGSISLGYVGMGLGRKIDKNTAAVKASAS